MESLKLTGAQQAKSIINYKNIKYKLLKTNAALWYNKTYISIYIHVTVHRNRFLFK